MKSHAQSLSERIRKAFPLVERPDDAELTVHGEPCAFCSGLLDDLGETRGKEIPADRVRCLFGELSCLSPAGFRWALPSYLDAIFADDANLELGEFLAYHFCGELRADEDAEREARTQILTPEQIDCLVLVLRELRAEYGRVYFDSFDEAIAFLQQRRDKMHNKPLRRTDK
jgi:hypothetical protein